MKYRYLLLFLLTTVIWGFAFLVVKDLTNRAAPVYFILTCRFVLGAATLAMLRTIAKSPKLSRREIVQGALVGSVLFAAFATQTWGTSLTTPAKNGMLTGTYVLFVPLFSTIYTRKIRWRPIANAFVCIVGLFFFFEMYRDVSRFDRGAFLSLASGVCFAIHFLLTDRIASKSDPINLTTTQLATVAAWASTFCCAFDLSKLDVATLSTSRAVLELVFLGLVSTGFAYWTQILAQSKLEASVVAVVACLESIFAVAFSILFGFEKISFGIIVGTAFVVVSTVSAALSPPSSEKKTTQKKPTSDGELFSDSRA